MRKTMLTALILAAMTAVAAGHDMFLKLKTFFLQPHSEVTVALFNGTFDKSENIITRDRMLDVSMIGPQQQRAHPDTSQWRDGWNDTLLDLKTGEAGTYVLGVSTKARPIELSAEDFNNYLAHDGVLDMLAARKKSGELDKAATELYSKHVKTVFQVGEERTESYNTNLGYPIEIVPQQNPYRLKAGDVLEVLVLRAGKPVANQLVYASYAGYHAHAEQSEEHDEAAAHLEAVKTRTDQNGIATITLSEHGQWYVRLIHMVKSEQEGIDYESNWATLTFELKE